MSMTIKERLVKIETLMDGLSDDVAEIKECLREQNQNSRGKNRAVTYGIPGGAAIAAVALMQAISSIV